jgi:hypothetical protein
MLQTGAISINGLTTDWNGKKTRHLFFWPKYFSNIKQWKLSQRKKIEVHSMMQLSIQLQIFYFQWRIFVIKCCYSNCNIIYQKAEKHVFFLIQTIKNPFIEIAPVCNIWLDQRFDLYIRCYLIFHISNLYSGRYLVFYISNLYSRRYLIFHISNLYSQIYFLSFALYETIFKGYANNDWKIVKKFITINI